MGVPISGVGVILKVYCGGGGLVAIAASRSATLALDTDEIDITSKDSPSWHSAILGNRSWSVDFESLLVEDHTTYDYLRNAYLGKLTINMDFLLPAGGHYNGDCIVSSLTADGPHDDVLGFNGSLKGSEALVYA
jgi:predicted secreted protein